MTSNNQTIAKNTAFLYIRMLFVMVVSLYTSRVILKALGVNDFGLYQTVGGVVGFLAFISNALATATSRYLTFSLGEGDTESLRKTFTTTLVTHLIIGAAIVLFAETIGLWYVYNKMVIPEDRFTAAVIIYHLSIITAFISIMQVPFNAQVIAHEKMSVFAYIGIVEALSKLGIIYLLYIGGVDRLILYAVLLFVVQICIFLFYFFYCKKCFKETVIRLEIERKIFREIFGFSGWSLLANGSIALSNQGIILLLNLFFAPAVVTARTISLQVNGAASLFVQNFRTAANPQIIKRYASGDLIGSKVLLLESTKFSYFLMLLIALPLLLLADPLLHLWLVEVPEYTTLFLQIVIVQSLFQVFDTSFYTALYAKGRIKENALLSPLIIFLCFPIVYILFKMGFDPVALSWAYLVGYAILGVIVKPILINRIADYNWSEIIDVFKVCFIVTLIAVPIPVIFYFRVGVDKLSSGALILVISLVCVLISVWFFGLTKDMRARLLGILSDFYKSSINRK